MKQTSSISLTERLINHCQRPVGKSTRKLASLLLLDWLGCIVAAPGTAAANAFRQFFGYSAAPNPSVTHTDVFNTVGKPLPALEAAFANGALGNFLDMDDLHRQSLLHTGDTVMPAALAVG